MTEVSSLGCHSDLWDPENRRLSSLVDDAGWRGKFPPIESVRKTAGRVRPDIVDHTGLTPNCVVKTGVHDSNASYLRHLRAHDKPFTVISTGTWIVLMTAGGDPTVLDESRDMLANVDVFGDPVASARFMGGREYAAIAGEDGLGATVEPRHIADLIDRGTMALPSFVESCGPFANRTGEILGPAPKSVSERAALATLYCALMCDASLNLLGVRRGPLIVEGSFAGNRAFCSVLAQLRRQPVHVSEDDTGTVVGATLLTHDLAYDLARQDTQPERSDTTTPIEPTALPELGNYKAQWMRCCG